MCIRDRSDLVQISQIRHGKSTLSQPFSVTNLGNSDRVWSCPDFPNSSRKIHPQPAIFRFPKFVTENPPSASHFPWQIWETLIVSDLVQISQIRHGKSSLSQPFSVTNLGNPDHVWSCPEWDNLWRREEKRRTKRNSMGLDFQHFRHLGGTVSVQAMLDSQTVNNPTID